MKKLVFVMLFFWSSVWSSDQILYTKNADGLYVCPIEECSKAYGQITSLIFHCRSLHAKQMGLSLFACSVCSVNFSQRSDLKKHQDIHEGIRYGCILCQKDYTQASDTRKHIKKKHPEIEDKFINTHIKRYQIVGSSSFNIPNPAQVAQANFCSQEEFKAACTIALLGQYRS